MEGLQGKFQEKFIAQALKKANLTLSIAESCTGGLACHKITNIPGSSEYFIMGIVSYSNKSKIDFLDVPENIIKRYGAVSRQTARYMAEGIRNKAKTNISLSITGIAGPTGGTPKKPVGLVYIGLASADKKTLVKKYQFKGSRIEIKQKAANNALKLLSNFLENA